MNKTIIKIMTLTSMAWIGAMSDADACTGITLHTLGGETVPARSIEWAGNDLESKYAIVPRHHKMQSMVPGGEMKGLTFTARYGFVGLAVQQPEFVVEGLNEAGLSAGLFYFPGCGEYEPYKAENNSSTVVDLQLVSWILSQFSTIDDLKAAITKIHITNIDPRAGTVHWRITEPNGKQVVLEIVDGKLQFFDSTATGVLTNSPGYEWHLANLNNYVNLRTGVSATQKLGNLELRSWGGGSGMHGLPGDMTPPSRFVRAAFFSLNAPAQPTAEKSITQAFHILNNFDIPTGIQFAPGDTVPDIPSATQWTVASDLSNRRIYYRTMYNSNIRCFDLKTIDFGKVKYQWRALDEQKTQPIEVIRIK
ncbi:MAG: linear amide C-N hydrolase [Muribaculaceae bacterium]